MHVCQNPKLLSASIKPSGRGRGAVFVEVAGFISLIIGLCLVVCVCVFDQPTGPWRPKDKMQGCVLKPWRHGQRQRRRGEDGQEGHGQT